MFVVPVRLDLHCVANTQKFTVRRNLKPVGSVSVSSGCAACSTAWNPHSRTSPWWLVVYRCCMSYGADIGLVVADVGFVTLENLTKNCVSHLRIFSTILLRDLIDSKLLKAFSIYCYDIATKALWPRQSWLCGTYICSLKSGCLHKSESPKLETISRGT